MILQVISACHKAVQYRRLTFLPCPDLFTGLKEKKHKLWVLFRAPLFFRKVEHCTFMALLLSHALVQNHSRLMCELQ